MALSLIDLFGVLLVAWVAGALTKRLGYPPILGELLAGMVFGPAALGLFHDSDALRVLADVGVYLLMLYIGMEVDPKALRRASAGGLLAAIGGFIVPFAAGYAITLEWGGTMHAGLFLGLAMGVTSLATKSRILVDLNLVGTRIASVLLVGALLSDTAALVVFSGILSLATEGGVSLLGLLWVGLKAVAFFGAAIWLGIRLFPRLGTAMRGLGLNERTANFTLVLLIGLVFAEMAELAGLHAILGAFMAGMFLREGVLSRRLSHEIATLVHDLSIGFLAPIFFVMAGFHVDFGVVVDAPVLLVSVIGVATVAKIVGTALFYLPSGHGLKEGLAIGAGMNGRGAVEIIIAEIGLSLGLIDSTIFSILVLMAFVTTMTVPVLLELCVRWLQRDGELAAAEGGRVLTVIFGANALGHAIAEALDDPERVVFIDRNEIACDAARRRGFAAVHGDLFDPEVLASARAAEARQFVAVVPNAHLCALAVRHARDEFQVPHCYTLQAHRGTTPIGGRHEPGIAWLSATDALAAQVAVGSAVEEGQLETLVAHEPLDFVEASEHWAFGSERLPLVLERYGERTPLAAGKDLLPGDQLVCLPLRPVIAAPPAPPALAEDWQVLDLPEVTTIADWAAAVAPHVRASLGAGAERLLDDIIAPGYVHIAPGVAIPHATGAVADQLQLLAIRTKHGLVCPAAPQPALAQFLIVAGSDRRGDYLRLLARVARLVQTRSFLDIWQRAADPSELQRLLDSDGERLGQPGED